MQIILSCLLLLLTHSQPQCSSTPLPPSLPLLASQSPSLDLSQYLHGPNLTVSLGTPSPHLHLQPKSALLQSSHNIGSVLSSSTSASTFTMLAMSTIRTRYYIYYAPVEKIADLSLWDLPADIQNCTHHAVSMGGDRLAVTCRDSKRAKYVLVVGWGGQWQRWDQALLVEGHSRQVGWLTPDKLVVTVWHANNSYVQLWDASSGRIMGVYDRTFFNVEKLYIRDVQVSGGYLYLLDYYTGIYQLQLRFQGLIVVRLIDLTLYSKMAVHGNSILVAKQSTLTQFTGKSVFKYQSASHEPIAQLLLHHEYLIAYTASSTTTYLRGLHTPYLSTHSAPALRTGLFINGTRIVQTLSELNNSQVLIQQLFLNHPILTIDNTITDGQRVRIDAVSHIDGQSEVCVVQFVVVKSKEQDMSVYENTYTRNGTEHIYMNRPGRAEVDLRQYGMGADLEYEILQFQETVNLSYQVRKVNKIERVLIEGIDKFTARATYFSQTCGMYQNQCPLAIDTTLQLMKYYGCSIQRDRYAHTRLINCTQRYRQFRFSQYLHYNIWQPPSSQLYFYQIWVPDNIPSLISIRKMQLNAGSIRPVMSGAYRIPGANKYGENNITVVQFDEQNKILYLLLQSRKEIHVVRVIQAAQSITLEIRTIIDSEKLKGRYFAPRGLQLDSDGMLWVKNYDEIMVVDASRGQLLRTVELDVGVVRGYGYGVDVVESRTAGRVFMGTGQAGAETEKINEKFLVISNVNNTLLMAKVSKTYQLTPLQQLPLYEYTLPGNKTERVIQSLGNSLLFVTLFDRMRDYKVNAIYDLSAITLVSTFYGSIQTKKSAVPAYFHLSSQNPVMVFVEPGINSTASFAYQIAKTPSLLLTVSNMIGQTKAQNLIIRVYNQKNGLRHSVVLGISNSPQNLTKGVKYPYAKIRKPALQKYIEAESVGWVEGNVLKVTYACKNCYKPDDNETEWVDVKGRLWTKQEIPIIGGSQFEVIEQGKGSSIGLIASNSIYSLNINTQSPSSLYQLTNLDSDTVLKFLISQTHSLILAVIRSQVGQLCIQSFSTNSFKGFPLSRLTLPDGRDYIYTAQLVDNVLIVLDLRYLYIVAVDAFGGMEVIDYVNQVEAGGAVCWTELLARGSGQYMLTVTLCESGLTYFSFSLQQGTFKLLSKQTLDLKSNLNTLNIQIPTDSTFRRSVSVYSPETDSLTLTMIISNFNSIQWQLQLRNNIISKVSPSLILNRYGDFSASEDISFDPSHRFALITYYGFYQAQYQYIHAIYDLHDTYPDRNGLLYSNCYIMQAFTSAHNHRPQFISPNNLLSLSNSTLSRIDVDNKFRAVIHNQNLLHTQSLFVVPYTPISSLSIELIIQGIDIKVWQFWQVALIVLGCIVGVAVLGVVVVLAVGRYRSNKKLVPLLVDYAEYEEDLAQEIERNKQRGSLITDNTQIGVGLDRGSSQL